MEKDNILFLQQFFGNDKKKKIQQKRNEYIKTTIKNDDTNIIHKDCNLKIHNLYNINKKLVKEVKDLKTQNEELQIQFHELSEWKKEHICKCDCSNNFNIEDIRNDIMKEININVFPEYVEIKKINESYNKKILQLESDIEKIQLYSKNDDNKIFLHLKEQNKNLLESNNILDKKVKELNLKIENVSINDVVDPPTILNSDQNIEDPILENKSTDVINNKMEKIIKENINKIIVKIDKLYKKTFTDEQININKSLISLYSNIYDLIKDKDEKKDAIYINDILDSASTDSNRARFKKIIKVANFIYNNKYLNQSRIVIPLYMFKVIPINSIDDLFYDISEHYKNNENNISKFFI